MGWTGWHMTGRQGCKQREGEVFEQNVRFPWEFNHLVHPELHCSFKTVNMFFPSGQPHDESHLYDTVCHCLYSMGKPSSTMCWTNTKGNWPCSKKASWLLEEMVKGRTHVQCPLFLVALPVPQITGSPGDAVELCPTASSVLMQSQVLCKCG